METKKERVFKVLRNEEVRDVPVGFWHHYLEDEHVDALKTPAYHTQNVEGAKKFKEEFDPDFVKVMTDGYFYLPIVLDTSSVETLPNFSLVPITHPWFQKQIELAKEYREIYGKDIAIFHNLFAPLWHFEEAVRKAYKVDAEESHEIILGYLKENPEAVASRLDKIADNLSLLLKEVVKEGVTDGIYLSAQDMHRYIPDALYRLYVTPSEKKVLENAKAFSPYNLLHICGWRGNTNFLTIYQDYPAIAFNWAVNTECLSLREGKKFFHDKCVIGGFLNTEDSILFTGNKGEIQNYTQKLLKDVGRKGVIIGADCTLPRSIDYEKIQYVREACKGDFQKIVG